MSACRMSYTYCADTANFAARLVAISRPDCYPTSLMELHINCRSWMAASVGSRHLVGTYSAPRKPITLAYEPSGVGTNGKSVLSRTDTAITTLQAPSSPPRSFSETGGNETGGAARVRGVFTPCLSPVWCVISKPSTNAATRAPKTCGALLIPRIIK